MSAKGTLVTAIAEESTAIAAQPARDSGALDRLISQAIERDLEPEKLGQLLAMRENEETKIARARYFESFAAFQMRCPIVTKSKEADRYKYAPISDIVAQVGALEAECGLTHRFEEEVRDDGTLLVTCIITHIGGHSEASTWPVPPTEGVRTSPAQSRGVMSTYGRRHSYTAALGITVADEDMDGRLPKPPPEPVTDEQVAELEAALDEIEADRAKFCQFLRVKKLSELTTDTIDRAWHAIEAKRARAAK